MPLIRSWIAPRSSWGGDGDDKPTNVTFANNIFTDPDDNIFEDPTGTETWISNLVFGDLGMSLPTSGMTRTNPNLIKNSAGFWGLAANSSAIDAAQAGYAPLPQFEGMDEIDMEIVFDLMRQNRPTSTNEKDLGCNEYPHNVLIQPIATEENTGPSYNTSSTTSSQNRIRVVKDLIRIHPNPVADQLNIEITSRSTADLHIEIINAQGRRIQTFAEQTIFAGTTTLSKNVADLPAGLYTIRASSRDLKEGIESIQTTKFIKSK